MFGYWVVSLAPYHPYIAGKRVTSLPIITSFTMVEAHRWTLKPIHRRTRITHILPCLLFSFSIKLWPDREWWGGVYRSVVEEILHTTLYFFFRKHRYWGLDVGCFDWLTSNLGYGLCTDDYHTKWACVSCCTIFTTTVIDSTANFVCCYTLYLPGGWGASTLCYSKYRETGYRKMVGCWYLMTFIQPSLNNMLLQGFRKVVI